MIKQKNSGLVEFCLTKKPELATTTLQSTRKRKTRVIELGGNKTNPTEPLLNKLTTSTSREKAILGDMFQDSDNPLFGVDLGDNAGHLMLDPSTGLLEDQTRKSLVLTDQSHDCNSFLDETSSRLEQPGPFDVDMGDLQIPDVGKDDNRADVGELQSAGLGLVVPKFYPSPVGDDRNMTSHNVDVTSRNVDVTSNTGNVDVTGHDVDVTSHNVDVTSHNVDMTSHNVVTSSTSQGQTLLYRSDRPVVVYNQDQDLTQYTSHQLFESAMSEQPVMSQINYQPD